MDGPAGTMQRTIARRSGRRTRPRRPLRLGPLSRIILSLHFTSGKKKISRYLHKNISSQTTRRRVLYSAPGHVSQLACTLVGHRSLEAIEEKYQPWHRFQYCAVDTGVAVTSRSSGPSFPWLLVKLSGRHLLSTYRIPCELPRGIFPVLGTHHPKRKLLCIKIDTAHLAS